jgi:hypothetical protein
MPFHVLINNKIKIEKIIVEVVVKVVVLAIVVEVEVVIFRFIDLQIIFVTTIKDIIKITTILVAEVNIKVVSNLIEPLCFIVVVMVVVEAFMLLECLITVKTSSPH